MVVGDHPRSRGVYRILSLAFARVTGSSPLARGLHSEFRLRVARLRIIPARAGFTRRRRGDGYSIEDHPRSRGVYRDLAVPGLRPRRIIPARAGFTGRAWVPRPSSRDHPRSRGVYPRFVPDLENMGGSSPLARGLHDAPPVWAWNRGIIPARAGFTEAGAPCSRSRPDHPRSRGVYPSPEMATRGPAGSSPLARGLRGVGPGQFGGPGIIPARAGFTGNSTGKYVGF